ncbi:hypothetical protein [Engelhardtia mirabilis]|uniref:Zinc-finger domain-containing protein n=1 Tax=Engelhardtia mirabilis TaxID=2528011 RepID=A0A518BET9_9BACT|nr:hypothetical protein Pla133_05650 [Planctomycetes bacterium Pla133]QDU99826.1 hypothetical protein Pla86_05650 [Planctomycetes bacterium Pla86]
MNPLAHHDHDALLEALTTGELDPSDPLVREQLERCPECRAEVEVIFGRIQRLNAAARDQAQDLAAAARFEGAPGEQEVERLIERFSRGEFAQPSSDRPRAAAPARPEEPGADGAHLEPNRAGVSKQPISGPWLLRVATLAAAAVLLLSLGWWLGGSGRESIESGGAVPAPIYMGEGLTLLAPTGGVRSFDEFRWAYDERSDVSFVLRVYDAAAGGEPLIEVETEWTHWTPSPAQLAALPPLIDWEVEVLGPFGELLAGPVRGPASRSSD